MIVLRAVCGFWLSIGNFSVRTTTLHQHTQSMAYTILQFSFFLYWRYFRGTLFLQENEEIKGDSTNVFNLLTYLFSPRSTLVLSDETKIREVKWQRNARTNKALYFSTAASVVRFSWVHRSFEIQSLSWFQAHGS